VGLEIPKGADSPATRKGLGYRSPPTIIYVRPGDVVGYLEVCSREGLSLQRGMNFRSASTHSVVLMSTRPGAPYHDVVRDDGRTLIYEGHDAARSSETSDPKAVDQPLLTDRDTLTQNGRFYMAAEACRNQELPAEPVRVYEKVRSGVWVYNGTFRLVDAWQEESHGRLVFKFRLELIDQEIDEDTAERSNIEHTRMIPTPVKLEVWKRDHGRCVKCGAEDNLHFDHIIPFSRGGSSLISDNVQLLCVRHNLEKRDQIA
jgi:hypothetical protein